MPTVQELVAASRLVKGAAGSVSRRNTPAPVDEAFDLTTAAADVGAFGLNAVSAVGNFFDTPGSMIRDVAGMLTTGRWVNPFDQLLTPFTDENRTTGRQLLENMGARKNRETGISGWFRDPAEGALDVGGFALEVLLDPFGSAGKMLKAPQAISFAVKGTGQLAAKGMRALPGGTRILNKGSDVLAAAGRLRRKYFDPSVGQASTREGQEGLTEFFRASNDYEKGALRSATDISLKAEEIGWSLRGEAPDALEKRGALARYLTRADARAKSPVLEDDLVQHATNPFPEPLKVVGVRLSQQGSFDALLDMGGQEVRLPVQDLQVVGDSLMSVPAELHPMLDNLAQTTQDMLAMQKAEGLRVGKYVDQTGQEYTPQAMLDAQQLAILIQNSGLRNNHKSPALRIATENPDARDPLFGGMHGTVQGKAGFQAIAKDPVWDGYIQKWRDANEALPPQQRLADIDGRAVMVMPDHVGLRHLENFADKVGMEPLEMWRTLGMDPEQMWAPADDVGRALEKMRQTLDAEARSYGPTRGGIPGIYFGKQIFRDLVGGKNTAVPLVDPKNLQAGYVLPHGQQLNKITDPKQYLESVARGLHGDAAKRVLAAADEDWAGKDLFEWFVDGERRVFTPDYHSNLATQFNASLKGLKKAATEKPVHEMEAIADSFRGVFKNRYSHLVEEHMPFFDDKGLLQFIDNTPGPTAGSSVRMTMKDFQMQQAALKKSKEAMTVPFGAGRDAFRKGLTQVGYADEQADAVTAVVEAQARAFAVDAGTNPDDYFRKITMQQGDSAPAGALLQPVFHGTPHDFAPEPGFPHGRPRLDKMGSGEGGQAYAWGWYSAQNSAVSKTYQAMRIKQITRNIGDMDPDEQLGHIDTLANLVSADKFFGTKGEAAKELELLQALQQNDFLGFDTPYQALREITKGDITAFEIDDRLKKAIEQFGNEYKLEIPDDAIPRMLDLDLPFKEQSNEVRTALIKGVNAIGREGASGEFIRKQFQIDKELKDIETARAGLRNRPMTAEMDVEWRKLSLRQAALQKQADTLSSRASKTERHALELARYMSDGELHGMDALKRMEKVFSKKAAAEFFDSMGLVGTKFKDRVSRVGGESDTRNFVIWNQGVLDQTAMLEKNGQRLDAMSQVADDTLRQEAKGAVNFVEDGKAIVTFFQSKDVSTALHEIAGHVARRNLPPRLQAMAEQAFGVKKGAVWTTSQEEAFANGIERYFRDGQAPTEQLKGVFAKFAAWLSNIYKTLIGTRLKDSISPEMKELFDRMHMPELPDNFAAHVESGKFSQRTVNRHEGLAELLRDRENFREFGGFGNNPIVDHFDGMKRGIRGVETSRLLQRFVSNSVANEVARKQATQSFSQVRMVGESGEGVRVSEMLEQMPALDGKVFVQRIHERLRDQGVYGSQLTDGMRSQILETMLDGKVVREFQDGFKLQETIPTIADPLKLYDSFTTVMKAGLLSTPGRINRDLMSSTVMAWTKGLIGLNARDAVHIKNGVQIMRGKAIDFAPDTDEIRELVRRAGGDPNSTEERLRVFKSLWASRSGGANPHGVQTADTMALETSGQADRFLDVVPGNRQEGLFAQIKRNSAGQSIGQQLNPLNVAGTWTKDKAGRPVQRSTDNLLANVANATSNVMDKGMKLGVMMAQLEKGGRGAKFDDAYKKVAEALLNYDSKSFSQFERTVLKRVFPFYSFMSRSIQLVAGELMTNPGGRLAQTIRAQRMAQDSEEYTPYDLQDSAAVPLGKDDEGNIKYLTGFGLMHEDALQYLAPTQGVRGLGQKIIGSMNPALKVGLEYSMNTSTFFEGPMGGRRLDDLDPMLGRLRQTIYEKLGYAEPLKQGQSPRPVGGSLVESAVASSPAAAWLRILRTSTDSRRETPEKLVNVLTGVRTKVYSKEAQIREYRDRLNALEIEMGARPMTLVTGSRQLEDRARAEGDTVKADRLRAIRTVIDRLRKEAERNK